ncbi:MAG: hypothetical protein ACOZQL_07440 [Myxococcota bacterium]
MLSLESKVHVEGVSGAQVLDFLVHCDDAAYQRWWPGTHLRCHTERRRSDALGNVVFMDEHVGGHHLRMRGVVTEWLPGRRLVLQFLAGARLPAWLVLECDDDARGTTVRHEVRVGFERAPGTWLDGVWRRVAASTDLPLALDAHVKEEFPRLAALLRTGELSSTAAV